MSRIALFPGSFDPITFGHIEIIRRGLSCFDEIVIGVGTNMQKNTLFTAEQRVGWIREYFANEPRIRVVEYANQLTVAFALSQGARFLLRGLRNAADFEYERGIDLINKHLAEEVETVYLISSPHTSHISSTLVREVIRYKGKLRGLVPDSMADAIYLKN